MTKNFFSSTLSKVVATGVIAAACVGAVAAPASAAVSSSSTDVPRGIPAYVGTIDLNATGGLTLGKGEIIEEKYFYAAKVENNKMVAAWEDNDEPGQGVAAAAIPILKDGQPTGYYIEPEILTSPLIEAEPSATCDVYEGKPGAGGNKVTGMFTCDINSYYEQLSHWNLNVKPATK
jgi:hypothetical protein